MRRSLLKFFAGHSRASTPRPAGHRDVLASLGLVAVAAVLWSAPFSGAEAQVRGQSAGTNAAAADDNPITAERYLSPPTAVERLVSMQRDRNFTYSAASPGSGTWFLRTTTDGLPPLALLGKPYHNLGGFQVDRLASRVRNLTTRSNTGLELRNVATGKTVTVSVPAGARVGPTAWSPDGTLLAFYALFDNATHIYLADPATGQSRPLTRTPVLATHVSGIEWTADSRYIAAVLLPANRGAEPVAPAIATEPFVRVNEKNKLRTRTYASLLASPYEKELLRYYSTGQLALIDVKSRAVKNVGTPSMIRGISVSPDGAEVRVTSMDEPFSYALPVSSFGQTETVIDASGKLIAQLATRPLNERQGGDDPPARGAQDTSRRNMQWHPSASGMLFAQLVPSRPSTRARGDSTAAAGAPGAGGAAAARRTDRLMHWRAPYDSSSTSVLYETTNRITASRYSEDGKILFVSETGTGGTTEIAIFTDDLTKQFTLVAPSRAARDSAAGDSSARPAAGGRGAQNATSLLTTAGKRGSPSVMVSSDMQHVFLQGTTVDSAKDKSNRVWIDRIAIRTGDRTRLYESDGNLTESIAAVLDNDAARLVVTRESPTMPPQSFLVETSSKAARQLTSNVDLMPEVSKAIKRTIMAKRADGYTFKVDVTLPADYKEGTRLPAMFWFYPREFETQEAYDRSIETSGNDRRFPTFNPRSMAFLTTQGYAVVEPDAPIFAQNGLPSNDNYEADLRNNLAATIDALDSLAIIDRQRLGIGGHSYGAFSAVNAMVHTPYFKAGIAGDGNYNRTLTPNGFQSERRDLWQGRDTYLAMSPFLYADKLNGALLMYHSTDDQNVGTAPINSERLYHALQGLGKDVSLYMYPYEDHGPIARETVLDQWARWVAWLDKYVKGVDKDGKPIAMENQN